MKFVQILILLGLFVFESIAQKPISRTANTVGLISFTDNSKPGNEGFGTGTLMAMPISDKQAGIFLVTNKHVLPTKAQNDSIHFRLRNLKSNPPTHFDLAIPIFDKSGKFNFRVQVDPDGNDLVVINVSDFFNRNKNLEYLTENMFTTSFLIRRDSMERAKIDLGDEVIFIGFPNILYNKKNFSPIVRTGIIATEPSQDYYFNDIYRNNYFIKSGEVIPERLAGFLIDANVFNGSSGSIVFTKPRHLSVEPDGRLTYFVDPDGDIRVLGILTTSYFDFNSPMADRLQLGGVISADQILKTIDLYVSLHK